jgi:hypothetical protein
MAANKKPCAYVPNFKLGATLENKTALDIEGKWKDIDPKVLEKRRKAGPYGHK